MIVLYLKDNNQFLHRIQGFPELEERDGKLWWGSKVLINDLTKAGYKILPDQDIPQKYEWNEDLGEEVEVPQTLDELNLRGFTPEEEDKLAAPAELRAAKAKLDEFLALPVDQWTNAKAIEAIKFLLKVMERVVRHLL